MTRWSYFRVMRILLQEHPDLTQRELAEQLSLTSSERRGFSCIW
ncbi:winged helix-turn-helix transcriptional regulator [Ferrovum myxofaciens]